MPVPQQRWWRIIPVALIMYTIAYIDRTNVSLALDPKISRMMGDLAMDDERKGAAMGIFFFGYLILQIPGGYLASRWSAKKFVAALLVVWGICAVGCGFAMTFGQFEIMRLLLGVAEGGVFPAVLVLLSHWFPRQERARANAMWILCMPISVAFSAPPTGWLLSHWGWQMMLKLEGALPFLWLPIWLYFINDHPREARWISAGEREHLETTLRREAGDVEPEQHAPFWRAFVHPVALLMMVIYFLHNCATYGCMTFLTEGLQGSGIAPNGLIYGVLFAVPYVVTCVVMIITSASSDRKGERRGHLAAVYLLGGVCLIASVSLAGGAAHPSPLTFWSSYALLCLAVAGPFAAIAVFWAIPTETLPKGVMGAVMGLVNAVGNLGGFAGPYVVGFFKQRTGGSVVISFTILGVGLIAAAVLCAWLPKRVQARSGNLPSSGQDPASC